MVMRKMQESKIGKYCIFDSADGEFEGELWSGDDRCTNPEQARRQQSEKARDEIKSVCGMAPSHNFTHMKDTQKDIALQYVVKKFNQYKSDQQDMNNDSGVSGVPNTYGLLLSETEEIKRVVRKVRDAGVTEAQSSLEKLEIRLQWMQGLHCMQNDHSDSEPNFRAEIQKLESDIVSARKVLHKEMSKPCQQYRDEVQDLMERTQGREATSADFGKNPTTTYLTNILTSMRVRQSMQEATADLRRILFDVVNNNQVGDKCKGTALQYLSLSTFEFVPEMSSINGLPKLPHEDYVSFCTLTPCGCCCLMV